MRGYGPTFVRWEFLDTSWRRVQTLGMEQYYWSEGQFDNGRARRGGRRLREMAMST